MIRLASVNLNKGIRTTRRRAALLEWARRAHVDILLAQEPSKLPSSAWPALPGFRLVSGCESVATWVRETIKDPRVTQVASFAQRIEIGYSVIYNVYLSAYSQVDRGQQLRFLSQCAVENDHRPVVVVGDFNLAPRTDDGLNSAAPSDFNSEIDRVPFRELLRAARMCDVLEGTPPEFTIERNIGGRFSQFRCDLALVSEYWREDLVYRYDHSVRSPEFSITDHSAVLVDLPIDLEPHEGPEQLPMQFKESPGEPSAAKVTYQPHKTAMSRREASPIARAVVEILCPRLGLKSVLDYGCGRGADVDYYRRSGLEAAGYDPHEEFGWSDEPKGLFDIVTVAFVLNVLPDPVERIRVLEKAAATLSAGGIMLVATRSTAEIEQRARSGEWIRHNDGYWSQRAKGTFQKGISANEIRRLCERLGLAEHAISRTVNFGHSTAHLVVHRLYESRGVRQ